MSGEDSCIDDTNVTKEVSLVEDEKKVVKENRKRQINYKTENNVIWSLLLLHFYVNQIFIRCA